MFLGRSVTQHKQVSDVTVHAIDEEVRKIIDSTYAHATQILTDHMDKLHAMADALIKYETIDQAQIEAIMKGEEPPPPEDWTSSGSGPTAPATGADEDSGKEPNIGEAAGQH